MKSSCVVVVVVVVAGETFPFGGENILWSPIPDKTLNTILTNCLT